MQSIACQSALLFLSQHDTAERSLTLDRLSVLNLSSYSERRRLSIVGVLLNELVGSDGDSTELGEEVKVEVRAAVFLATSHETSVSRRRIEAFYGIVLGQGLDRTKESLDLHHRKYLEFRPCVEP